jgi:hypothetical protein
MVICLRNHNGGTMNRQTLEDACGAIVIFAMLYLAMFL